MYINEVVGKFGSDFSTYDEFKRFTERKEYKRIMKPLMDLPSIECNTCPYVEKCYGGCPVIWHNYSYNDIKAFRNWRKDSTK